MRPQMLNIPLRLSSTLTQSRSSFLAAHLLPSGKPYASLVVAAAIFHPISHKILILRRSPAEKLFPHHWEIPGGKVDDTDKTIWDALKREVQEETGLWIKKSDIEGAEMGFEWALGDDIEDDTEIASDLSSMDESEEFPDDTELALELNFMIMSEELAPEVKLDPQEHLESLWADEKDIVGLKMTPEMRCVVKKNFHYLNLRYRLGWAMLIFGWAMLIFGIQVIGLVLLLFLQ